MGKLVDMPQMTKHIIVDIRPTMRVGFLPYRSAALPQGTAVALWEREKTAEVRPAHLATSFCFTPKLLIISGR